MDSLQIVFKSDLEAGVNRGARMFAAHFEHPVVELISTMARQGHRLIPDAKILRVTEGYRPQRRPDRRDLHAEFRALDFTVVKEGGSRATQAEYILLAEGVRAKLGDKDYDFEVHGEDYAMHIHAEYDPKPERGVA